MIRFSFLVRATGWALVIATLAALVTLAGAA